MIYGICQSCLRVRSFFNEEAAYSARCDCGATPEQGDSYCACEACRADAERLIAGERNPKLCGIDEGVDLTTWSLSNGISQILGARQGDRGSAS